MKGYPMNRHIVMVPTQNNKVENAIQCRFEKVHNRFNSPSNSPIQKKIMKKSQRMRQTELTPESSANLNEDTGANQTKFRYRLDPKLLQSYGRRAATAQSSRRTGAVTFNISQTETGNETNDTTGADVDQRRMSAPELGLPPIADRTKTGNLTNGYITHRASTVFIQKYNRNSFHSDSSLQGYPMRTTTTSRTSSSSSQQSRGRVLSAGTDRRTLGSKSISTELIKEDTGSTLKLEALNKKQGMVTVATPRSSTNGYKRMNTVIGGVSNNNVTTVQKMGHHSKSETQISPLAYYVSQKQHNGMKRNNSDNKLTDKKKNSKMRQNGRTISVDKKDLLTGCNSRLQNNKNNVNGMRRFSSSLGLNFQGQGSDDGDDHVTDDAFLDSVESDRSNRVFEWIIGVTEIAEPPEEPVIEYKENPPQRDTAIRIVYEEKS